MTTTDLADARVANEEELEEVVVPVRHGRRRRGLAIQLETEIHNAAAVRWQVTGRSRAKKGSDAAVARWLSGTMPAKGDSGRRGGGRALGAFTALRKYRTAQRHHDRLWCGVRAALARLPRCPRRGLRHVFGSEAVAKHPSRCVRAPLLLFLPIQPDIRWIFSYLHMRVLMMELADIFAEPL